MTKPVTEFLEGLSNPMALAWAAEKTMIEWRSWLIERGLDPKVADRIEDQWCAAFILGYQAAVDDARAAVVSLRRST